MILGPRGLFLLLRLSSFISSVRLGRLPQQSASSTVCFRQRAHTLQITRIIPKYSAIAEGTMAETSLWPVVVAGFLHWGGRSRTPNTGRDDYEIRSANTMVSTMTPMIRSPNRSSRRGTSAEPRSRGTKPRHSQLTHARRSNAFTKRTHSNRLLQIYVGPFP